MTVCVRNCIATIFRRAEKTDAYALKLQCSELWLDPKVILGLTLNYQPRGYAAQFFVSQWWWLLW